VLVSARHDADAARRFFLRALGTLKVTPIVVVTDAAVYPTCSTSSSRRRGTMSSNTPTIRSRLITAG
jgi:transposase-like protein